MRSFSCARIQIFSQFENALQNTPESHFTICKAGVEEKEGEQFNRPSWGAGVVLNTVLYQLLLVGITEVVLWSGS